MKNKCFKLFLLVYFIGFGSCYAQSDEVWANYKQSIDDAFSNIPKNEVTTGLLIEKSIPYVNVSQYNGSRQSDTTTFEIWRKMYKQYCLAHYDYSGISLNQDFINTKLELVENEIDLGILAFAYNQIKPEMIEKRKVVLDTTIGKIKISGTNILDEKFSLSFAPIANKISVGTYNFTLSKDVILGNRIDEIQEIFIDFSDGNGFNPLWINQSAMVSYNQGGEKTISLKVKINGNYYYAFSKLVVEDESYADNMLKSATFTIEPDYGPATFLDNGIIAEYAIFGRCGSDGSIRKPYLIVSGFDPTDKNRLVDKSNKVNLYRVSNKDGYLDTLRNNGYDIIIYRSQNSTRSIIPNALNLVSFIKKINREKTSDNELIIAGASMGGLVVRYALTYMEYHKIDHQTKLFISVDSPQEGANVPLGIQFMIKYLNEDLLDAVDGLKKAENEMLNSAAAQEMLLYHHKGTSDGTAKCASLRTDFITEMNRIGGFPQQCRTVGLSMGSGSGVGQGFNAGDLLIEKDPKMSIFVPELTPAPRATWEFSVYAVPNKTSKKIYTESVKLKTCINFLGKTYCTDGSTIASRNISVSNTVSIDNAPGSIQNFHNTGAFKGQGDILGLDYLDLLDFVATLDYDSHPDNFIPSYSSLGLKALKSAPNTDIKAYLQQTDGVVKINDNQYVNTNGRNVSMFDVLYIENKNLDHIYDDDKVGVFTKDMISFMTEETSPSTVYVENETVVDGHRKGIEARDEVFIGNDVDMNQYNNGNFIAESGSQTSVLAGNKIVLEPGTKIEKGATFSAKTAQFVFCDGNNSNYVKSAELNIEDDEPTESQLEMVQLLTQYSEPVIMYPNPVDNELVISSNKTDNVVTIFNISGKKVFHQKFNKNVELQVSDLPEGVYLVKVKQGNGNVVTKQIIKQ